MKMRCCLILGSALILTASAALAGAYQETRRGKITVWNPHPNAGELAKWSGRRDKDGYATGYGTLTWYRIEAPNLTGSHIPFTRPVILSRYTGKMVKGKLEGDVVSVDASGRSEKVVFVNGHEATERIAKSAEPKPAEVAEQQPSAEVPRAELVEPAPPAAGPVEPPAAKPPVDQVTIKPPATEKQSQPVAAGRTSAKAQAEAEDSLRSLVGPPNALRMREAAEAKAAPQPAMASIAPSPSPTAAPARPDLAAAEVIELADSEARTHGYNLGEYKAPQAHYVAEEDAWTVSYNQKGADGSGDAKHFSVSVDDKTKRTSIGEK